MNKKQLVLTIQKRTSAQTQCSPFPNSVLIVTLDLLLIVPITAAVGRPIIIKAMAKKVSDEGERRRGASFCRGDRNPVAKARGRCEGGVNLQQRSTVVALRSVVGLILRNICDNRSERHGGAPG